MRGDVILVGEEHRRAAGLIVDGLIDVIGAMDRRFTLTVAGESGSGKSETGQALAEALEGYAREHSSFAVGLRPQDAVAMPLREAFETLARRYASLGSARIERARR